tara:strand:+ start:72 stop:938 length:867 start_codon:yes stop_codon:yes gene_type:complete
MSKKINHFIELTRIKKPIGYMLLFWPCIWGLTIVYDFNNELINFLKLTILFFLGSILMRSAGCIVNDIVDRNYDKNVQRTKNRPIASGEVSVKLGFIYVTILCSIALLVLLQFNKLTIILALASMPLAFSYPYMKRFTYWPQLFLGITFNYGLLLGWTSVEQNLDYIPIIFYFGAIFWTLGYDTIYGYQDIKDDEIIGVKSTSIKFKKNPKKFISLCYFISLLSIVTVGFLMNFSNMFFLFLFIPAIHMFYQIKNLNIFNGDICLKIFKSNNVLGLIIFANLLIGKII